MTIEVSFPRGGRKTSTHPTAKVSHIKFDLFGKKKPKHKKIDLRNEMGLKNTVEKNVCPDDIIKTTADLPSYRTIQEGMVMMGCIREIQKMTLSVLLPGRMTGRVMITQISAPYTKLLQDLADNITPEGYRPLNNIVHAGQYVSAKIMKINADEEKFQVSLSLSPTDVNYDLTYKSVHPGMLLWGAISGIEDHGYVIDLGIQNCRAFLPTANVDTDKTYCIGEPLWCVIQKSEIAGVASTVTINALKEKVHNTKVNRDTSLDYLLPGMQVDLTLNKILMNGLEGKFLNDYNGYVHEGYLKGILDKLSSYKQEQVVTARILFITPVTKLTFFTLRNFDDIETQHIVDGTLLNCTIMNITRGGLYVKLNNNYKGYVSYKRLKTKLSLTSELDHGELVRQNYKTGSQHACRVLSFDAMEQVYICTMEKEILAEQIFSYNDLTPGQLVTAEISEVQKNGLLIHIGRLSGFILNEHLTDTVLPSYINVKNKYSPGQKIKCRVWNMNPKNQSLLFTAKPSLVNSQDCLTAYEQAEHNKQYLGIIVQLTTKGVLVLFYQNVKGWIPQNQLSFEKVTNIEQMFTIGQIVNCTIIVCRGNKLSLSLQPPKAKSKRKKIRLGQHIDAVVTALLPNGLEVEVVDTKTGAVIPAQHLTKSPSLAELILNTYSVGDFIKNLVCVSSERGTPILSLRDNLITEKNIPHLKDLNSKSLLCCSVFSVNKKGILLQTPLKGFDKLVTVLNKNACDMSDNITNLNIIKNQCLYARVISASAQHIYASTELSRCWEGDLDMSKELLFNYLTDFKRIKDHLVSKNAEITKYNLGQIVTATVKEINRNNSITLSLPNDLNGKVEMEHMIDGLEIGKEVKGSIIGYNFQNNHLEITLKPGFISRINQKQNGEVNIKPGKNASADVISVNKDYILVALRSSGNRQLAYLPARLHTNDLIPSIDCYNVGDVIKVEILQIQDGYVIAVSKELAKKFAVVRKAMKRSLEDSEDGGKTKKRKLEKQKVLAENDNLEKEEHNKDIEQQLTRVEKKKNKKTKLIQEKAPEEESTQLEVIDQAEHHIKSKKKKNKQAKLKNEKEDDSIQSQETEQTENQSKSRKKKNKLNNVETQKIEPLETEPEEENIQEINQTENTKKIKKKKHKQPDELVEEETKSKKKNRKQTSEIILTQQTETKSKSNKRKNEESSDDEIEDKKIKVENNTAPVLSGMNDFWNAPAQVKIVEESSDEDDKEEEELNKKQKKKKLTPAERAELARIEEERLRKIEMELADPEATPKSADQFDRLVLANPNNSMMWISYIAFHLEGTEIEKARAVARKALNTIAFREEQEKLNVWIAFLNLENRYGTKESFSMILEEAVKMNDSLTVHLQALNILAESNKTTEFLELLNTVSKRYKQEPKMWTGAAEACYKCGQKEQARNLMQRAVKSLEERQHINVIVQFAFMESKSGEHERAEAVLEKILASYPKRVDVWCSYVDMLLKSDRTHIAKNVLERAVSQKLPPRKMKTLFTKFIQFETKYGDEESVKKVRQLASDYVNEALK